MRQAWALALLLLAACATAKPRPDGAEAPARPALLPLSEQYRVRDAWLAQRHAGLLPLLRKHGLPMWIVVTEEFHEDPLAPHVAPARPYAGNRDVFVFIDAGDAGLRKVALTSYAEETVTRFFESPEEPRRQQEALAQLYAQHRPARIGLSIGGRRGVTRSLTHDSHAFLAEALGPEAVARFTSAADLIEEYLDTRLPDERPHYVAAVQLTDALVREALSSRVVRPGVTRVGDLRAHLADAAHAAGVGLWFQPDVRVQRRGERGASSRGFLAVAKDDVVVQRGDVLHVDFGVAYLGLATDWQRMAYVLRDGEAEAPEGLRRALANTHALQDALMLRAARPGRSSADVYRDTMAEAEAKGLRAQVYSHPLGVQGHALGPGIDFRAGARQEAPRALRPGSYLAVELNTRTPVPEWDGQEVFMMLEDPAELGAEGYRFFVPRQEALYLIR